MCERERERESVLKLFSKGEVFDVLRKADTNLAQVNYSRVTARAGHLGPHLAILG